LAELTLVEAVNDCFHTELERDPSVMVMGEDVGRAGGVFRATAGLRDRFGPDRCVDTPLAEAGILGSAVGLCMAGWRPVCEMQYDAFSYPCLDQLITHVGRYRWRTGGGMEFLRKLRHEQGGKDPVVVFCTTENDVSHISAALTAGANNYVQKPFDREDLQAKIAAVGLI
jgi:pyruvate/2-oxoglutarate/acetoin dehydrogenase E1 component